MEKNFLNNEQSQKAALILRVGLGLVFLTGGWWKLSRAIGVVDGPDKLVAKYLSSAGYINTFFNEYLFSGDFLSPLGFLILLSGFEFISGLLLIIGFTVRPLSLIWGFLIWTFIIGLPIATTDVNALGLSIEGKKILGATGEIKAHTTPGLLVLIRDIAMSGCAFVLFKLGSGSYSLDEKLFDRGQSEDKVDWEYGDLWLRLSLGIVFIVGALFYGLPYIKSFIPVPFVLFIVGVLLFSGHFSRYVGAVTFLIILYYSIMTFIGKASKPDTGFWDWMNSIKREFVLLAASSLLFMFSPAITSYYSIKNLLNNPKEKIFGKEV